MVKSSSSCPGPSHSATWASQKRNLGLGLSQASVFLKLLSRVVTGTERRQPQTSLLGHREAETEHGQESPFLPRHPDAGPASVRRKEGRMFWAARSAEQVRAEPAPRTGSGDKEGSSHLLLVWDAPCPQGPERPGLCTGSPRR